LRQHTIGCAQGIIDPRPANLSYRKVVGASTRIRARAGKIGWKSRQPEGENTWGMAIYYFIFNTLSSLSKFASIF
jgi:hypothetical protein